MHNKMLKGKGQADHHCQCIYLGVQIQVTANLLLSSCRSFIFFIDVFIYSCIYWDYVIKDVEMV